MLVETLRLPFSVPFSATGTKSDDYVCVEKNRRVRNNDTVRSTTICVSQPMVHRWLAKASLKCRKKYFNLKRLRVFEFCLHIRRLSTYLSRMLLIPTQRF